MPKRKSDPKEQKQFELSDQDETEPNDPEYIAQNDPEYNEQSNSDRSKSKLDFLHKMVITMPKRKADPKEQKDFELSDQDETEPNDPEYIAQNDTEYNEQSDSDHSKSKGYATRKGKWKMDYDDNRKYKEEWEQEFPWLEPTEDKGAKCKYCNVALKPKKSFIHSHGITIKHLKVERDMGLNTVVPQRRPRTKKDKKNSSLPQAMKEAGVLQKPDQVIKMPKRKSHPKEQKDSELSNQDQTEPNDPEYNEQSDQSKGYTTRKCKWKMDYDGNRKYKKEWEQEFPWLEPNEDKGAKCKYCNVVLKPKKSFIHSHGITIKHLKVERDLGLITVVPHRRPNQPRKKDKENSSITQAMEKAGVLQKRDQESEITEAVSWCVIEEARSESTPASDTASNGQIISIVDLSRSGTYADIPNNSSFVPIHQTSESPASGTTTRPPQRNESSTTQKRPSSISRAELLRRRRKAYKQERRELLEYLESKKASVAKKCEMIDQMKINNSKKDEIVEQLKIHNQLLKFSLRLKCQKAGIDIPPLLAE